MTDDIITVMQVSITELATVRYNDIHILVSMIVHIEKVRQSIYGYTYYRWGE